MIEQVFKDWKQDDAELLSIDTRNSRYEPIDTAAAAAQAKQILGIEASQTSGYIIPLFTENNRNPSREYVIYKPDREAIRWYDTGFGISGTERTASCEKLDDTIIGHRLRFWLPENQPSVDIPFDEGDLPKGQVEPSDELSASEQETFFDTLRGFVKSEMKTRKEANWEAYQDLGFEKARQRGKVSGPFLLITSRTGNNGKPAYQFQMEVDDDDEPVNLRSDEGLFEENLCIADIQAETDEFPIEVELIKVGDSKLVLQPMWGQVSDISVVEKHLESDEVELWLHDLLNPIPYDRRLSAINQVKTNHKKRDLLTGGRPVSFSDGKHAIVGLDIELNSRQQLAVAWAESADDVVCIHGPPGTGKTRTLTAYVRQAVARGQSVLVTAHSNQAVDNLLVGDSTRDDPEDDTLHAMAQATDSISIARAGNNSRNDVVQRYYQGKPTSGADVVASTTSGAAQFDADTFDVAVVDEATQASRPATSIALNCSKKLVLAGDHKQLPPFCADETMQEEDIHISLFEYLLNRYGNDISVLLPKQYRMNEEIAAFPNKAFYDGALETADRNKNWTVEGLKPIVGVDIVGSERRQSHGNSMFNIEESEAVAKQVKLLLQSGLDPEDIGIITAYTGQIGKIHSQLHQLDIDQPKRITIDTVDSFQGGEREAIIVSFVRSNEKGHSGFLEFPEEGPRRLNVALTRARKRLVLIGDWDTLGTVAPHRSPEESCAHHYANLAEHLNDGDRMLSQK
jgi:hypothetical protein